MARILISSSIDPISSSHSRLHAFAQHLSEKHDVSVISIKDYWKASFSDSSSNSPQHKSYDTYYCTNLRLSPYIQDVLTPISARRRSLGKILRETDIHLAYNTMVGGLCFSRLFLRRGIKTVYDLADDLPSMVLESPQLPFFARPIGAAIAKVVLEKSIELAEKVTVTASSLGTRYSVPSDKMVLVPNGVTKDFLAHNGSNNLRREYGLNDCFNVGYVGVFREWIDFKPVFAVMKRLKKKIPQLRLILVGGQGPLARLNAQVKEFEISDIVLFTGFVDYVHVPDYIDMIDVGLVPFRSSDISEFAFPLKILEYMALGKPVITTPTRVVQEVFGKRVLYTHSESDLYEQILTLYQSAELRGKLGREGKKFVQTHFTWEGAFRKLDEVLEE